MKQKEVGLSIVLLFLLTAILTATAPGQAPTPERTVDSAGTVRKNSIGMELVYIPEGSFMMGSSESEIDGAMNIAKDEGPSRSLFDNEKPQRRVTISNGFWMGKFEVTQGQWQAIMGDDPSSFKACGLNCPVEMVSWDDIQIFLKKLNQKNDGFVYSLPTEAQWEYAARAGTTGSYGGTGDLEEMGWYLKNSGSTTHPVGQKRPNAFGLYDMHGNVWEWVQDIYSSSYSHLPTDGSANLRMGDSSVRILRGGGWSNYAYHARSATRHGLTPSFRNNLSGFRVVARPQ